MSDFDWHPKTFIAYSLVDFAPAPFLRCKDDENHTNIEK